MVLLVLMAQPAFLKSRSSNHNAENTLVRSTNHNAGNTLVVSLVLMSQSALAKFRPSNHTKGELYVVGGGTLSNHEQISIPVLLNLHRVELKQIYTQF